MAPKYEKQEALPPYLAVKQDGKYRVIAIPGGSKPTKYPPIGSIGEVCWTSSFSGACLNIQDEKYVIPFDCIEDVELKPMGDDVLISIMLENPYGVYKLLRGLWRLTKKQAIRDFMERGEFQTGSVELVKRNNKTSTDYHKQWEEVEQNAVHEESLSTWHSQDEIVSGC